MAPSLTQLVSGDNSLVAYWTLDDVDPATVYRGSLFYVNKSDVSDSGIINLTKYEVLELSYPITGLINGIEYSIELGIVYGSVTSDEYFAATLSGIPVDQLSAPTFNGTPNIVYVNDLNGEPYYDVTLTINFQKQLSLFNPSDKVSFKIVNVNTAVIRHETRSIDNTAPGLESSYTFGNVFSGTYDFYVYTVDANGPSVISSALELTIGTKPNNITNLTLRTLLAGDFVDGLMVNDTGSPYVSGTVLLSASTLENHTIFGLDSFNTTKIKISYSYDDSAWNNATEIDLTSDNSISNGTNINIFNVVLSNFTLNSVVSIKVAGVNISGIGNYCTPQKVAVFKNSIFEDDIVFNNCTTNGIIDLTGSVNLGSLPKLVSNGPFSDIPVTYLNLVFSGPNSINGSYSIPLANVSENWLSGGIVNFHITEEDLDSNLDLTNLGTGTLTVTANIFEIVEVPSAYNSSLTVSDYILSSDLFMNNTYSDKYIITNNSNYFSKTANTLAYISPEKPTTITLNDLGDHMIKVDVHIPNFSADDYNAPTHIAAVISTSTFPEDTPNLVKALVYDLENNYNNIYSEISGVVNLPVSADRVNNFVNSQFKYVSLNSGTTTYSVQFDNVTNNTSYYVWTVTLNAQGFSAATKSADYKAVDPDSYTGTAALSVVSESNSNKNSRVSDQRALLNDFETQSGDIDFYNNNQGVITLESQFRSFVDSTVIINKINTNTDQNNYKNELQLSWPAFSQTGYSLNEYHIQIFENEDYLSSYTLGKYDTSYTFTNATLGKSYYFTVTPMIYITALGSSTQFSASTLTSSTVFSKKSIVITEPLFYEDKNSGNTVLIGAINLNGHYALNSSHTNILVIVLPDAPTGGETVNTLVQNYYVTSGNNPELQLYILHLNYKANANKFKLLYAADSSSYDLIENLN
jgi:hypothetical protein